MDGGAGEGRTLVAATEQAMAAPVEEQEEQPAVTPPEANAFVPPTANTEIALPTATPAPTPAPRPTAKPAATAKPSASPKPSPKPAPKKAVVAKLPARTSPKPNAEPAGAAKKSAEDDQVGKASPAVPGNGGSGGGGSGPGGASQFGWYSSMLHDRFYREWVQPTSFATAGAKMSAQVKIRIEKDGRVSDFTIIRSSGNVVVDESVAAVGKRVTKVDPLPNGLGTGGHYDVNINFELNAE